MTANPSKVYRNALKEYNSVVAALEKGLNGLDDDEDVAIVKYELLHKILEVDGALRWLS